LSEGIAFGEKLGMEDLLGLIDGVGVAATVGLIVGVAVGLAVGRGVEIAVGLAAAGTGGGSTPVGNSVNFTFSSLGGGVGGLL
jgi:hypothetical protein